MQQFVLSKKKEISFVSLGLIISAFIFHYGFRYDLVAEVLLIVASIMGVVPIGIQAYQSLKVKVISIDVLVTVAVIGAFMIRNYEESAIVTFLFLFGTYLEQRTLNKTRSAIKELTEMAPESAMKKVGDGQFVLVDIDEVEINDVLLVKTGARVPVDGKVIEGSGYINEASITGESISLKKTVGNFVYAGTILENGTLYIEAEKIGEDTTFGKIIELVEEAQDSKSKTERFINQFSKYYTPLVLALGIVVYIIFKDVELAITILVLGCPGALVIGVPVSNVAGIGNGAKHGILLKGSEVILDFSKIDVMVFDKTGTLTYGMPKVAELRKYSEDLNETLAYIKAVERESDHPLAKAVVEYVSIEEEYKISKTEVIKGGGIKASILKDEIVIGNLKLMEEEKIMISDLVLSDVHELEKQGNSIVIAAVNKDIKLAIGIKDQIRANVGNELQVLKKLGVKELVLLSGDNQGTVDLVAHELKMTEAHGNMLPEDKQAYIKNLQSKGKVVAFVGDGVNDSPSLAIANIGIAMGSGTDVAIETSDVVLMNSCFSKLPHALGLAKAIKSNMIQNIVIAVGVVVLLLMSVLFSDWMNMTIGMLVHELSILLVIINGMRLIRYQLKVRREGK